MAGRQARSREGEREMSKRKWKQSSVKIMSVTGMMDCMNEYGGVWVSTMRKFMNTAWVLSQQLRVLESFVRKGFFWYPERNDRT